MKNYITYLKDFDPKKIETDLKTSINNKPTKAFWGSPVDAEYGWEHWCQSEDFNTELLCPENQVIWTLSDDSKILEIESIEDLEMINTQGYFFWNAAITTRPLLNFYRIKEDGYTAVELLNCYLGHMFVNSLEMSMNSWDCDSIVVLDPSKIIWLKK